MDPHSEIISIPERRLKPRITCDCHAEVQGHNGNGKKFIEGGRVINLSRNGMFLLVNRVIPDGTEVYIWMSIPTGFLELGTTKLAVRGQVVRGELHSESVYGIGVKFQNYRFI